MVGAVGMAGAEGMARAGRVVSGARLAVLLVGMAVSIESLTVARLSPEFSFASTSGLAATLELAAGGALVFAGTLALGSAARRRFGVMLAAAGVAWLLVEWNNRATGRLWSSLLGSLSAPPVPS